MTDLDQLLREKFTSAFRKGYISCKGFTMPQRFGELAEQIENWPVNEEDVWICSFPKTGTTWTQEMVWMIINNLDFEGGQVNLGIRSPFLEVSAVFDYRDIAKNNKDFEMPPFLNDSLAFVKRQQSPLCLKTHLPWQLLPAAIQTGAKQPKIIYVTRNPKDTCISYFHHCRVMEGFNGDFDEFCQLFLAGKLNYGPYWQHVLPFWQRRHDANVLFLKYEDMKKNLPEIIAKVAEFLNKPLNGKQIDVLAQHLSFESMKSNKAVNYELAIELHKKYKLIKHDGVFMRSGTVGNYKAAMSQQFIDKFDEWEKENLKKTADYYL